MKKLKLKPIRSHQEARTYSIPYEEVLNAAQYEAVTHTNGPALIIAGAGTGKTRTLTYRVARLIEDGVAPESILLLTFTKKAAREMIVRASRLLDGRAEKVAGGTFHSFAHTTLRIHADKLGFNRNFSIIDQSDAEDVVNLLRSDVAGKNKRRFPRKKTLFTIFSASVNRGLTIEQIVEDQYPQFEKNLEDIEALREKYTLYKQKHNLMDYDDLLLNMHTLLVSNADVRKSLMKRYSHVMVDEYQDTNKLQHAIVKQIGAHGNIVVVGDDAQSIYSFRGAHHRNIIDFPNDFENCTVITLEENYRSTSEILDLSNEILKRASTRYDKELFSHIHSEQKPMLVSTENDTEQSKLIAQLVLEQREEGVSLDEMAVLFRSGFHSFELEIELANANIPFQKFGGFKFMETAHVKDVLAYLRVLVNPQDAVSLHRILLLHERVGPETSRKVIDALMASRWEAAKIPKFDFRVPPSVQELFPFLQSLNKSKAAVADLVSEVAGYYRPQLKKKHDDFNRRYADVNALIDMSERYSTLHTMVREFSLDAPVESVADIGPEQQEDEFLTLSTIHSAKGLEWEVVFIIWVLDGRFPSTRAFDTQDSLDEERRLMYVAVTRAKRILCMTYPRHFLDRETRTVLSKPSRFIDDMEDLLDMYMVEPE